MSLPKKNDSVFSESQLSRVLGTGEFGESMSRDANGKAGRPAGEAALFSNVGSNSGSNSGSYSASSYQPIVGSSQSLSATISLGELGDRALSRIQALWAELERELAGFSGAAGAGGEPIGLVQSRIALSYRRVALEVDLLFRSIATRELGSAAAADSLPLIMSRLGGGVVEEQLVDELVRFSRIGLDLSGYHQLATSSENGHRVDVAIRVALQKLQRVVQWYLKRRATLSRIEEEQEYSEEEGIFAPSIRHDVTQYGVPGCEVQCSLRLNHRSGQQLWLKGVLYRAGRAVQVKPNWQFWQDDTDSMYSDLGASGGSISEGSIPEGSIPDRIGVKGGLEVGSDSVNKERLGNNLPREVANDDRGAFASLIPLAITRNCCVVDAVKLFIPYAALSIPDSEWSRSPSGKPIKRVSPIVELELELLLLDESNRTLASRTANLTLNSSALQDRFKLSSPVPSPQAAGLWAQDPITGDSISRVKSRQGMRGGGRGSVECLTVSFDLDLNGKVESELRAELRLLNLVGDTVKRRASKSTNTVTPAGANSTGSVRDFTASITVKPQDSLARFSGLKFEVPLSLLELAPGKQGVVAEIAVLTRSGQVIVGTMTPVSLVVPNYIEQLGVGELSIAQGSDLSLGGGQNNSAAGTGKNSPAVIGIGSQADFAGTAQNDAQMAVTSSVVTYENFDGTVGVRVRPRISAAFLPSSDFPSSDLRVVASLETVSGEPLVALFPFGDGFSRRRVLLQSLIVPVDSLLSGGEIELSTLFDYKEILAALSDRALDVSATGSSAVGPSAVGSSTLEKQTVQTTPPVKSPLVGPSALAARVKVFSANDQLLGEHLNNFHWSSEAAMSAISSAHSKNKAAPKSETNQPGGASELGIVDLKGHGWRSADQLNCLVWCNVPAVLPAGGSANTVTVALYGGNGKELFRDTLIVGSADTSGSVSAAGISNGEGRNNGEISQVRIPFALDLKQIISEFQGDPAALLSELARVRVRLMLAADGGKLLHVVNQRLFAQASQTASSTSSRNGERNLIEEFKKISGLFDQTTSDATNGESESKKPGDDKSGFNLFAFIGRLLFGKS